jgi:hypothetical protein|nr:MAG TPA: hypothetical protein [Caudoviricetes sp.]
MTKAELTELLIDANIEVIKNALDSIERKNPLETAQNWYNNLNGVKFSDWGKDLFSYSIPIKEIKIPTEMVILCLNNDKKAEHILVNYLQRQLNKKENQFFFGANRIRELFVKLESRSPKDYIQNYPREDYKPLYNAQEIVNALLGSMRTFEDLVFLTKLKSEVILYIRPFVNLYRHCEWRVFVKDKKVIGISQQFYKETFPYDKKYIKRLEKDILYFMKNICIPNISVPNFVADLYVKEYAYLSNVRKFVYLPNIIETNPYGLSDPCLFETYDNLESSKELLKYNKE